MKNTTPKKNQKTQCNPIDLYRKSSSGIPFKRWIELEMKKGTLNDNSILYSKEIENFDEVTRPIILNVRNKSYEYIKKVSLNNMCQALGLVIPVGNAFGEHYNIAKYDERVELEYGLVGMSYLDFLRSIDSEAIRIGKIRVDAVSQYEKYNHIQVGLPLSLINKSIEGTICNYLLDMDKLSGQDYNNARIALCDFEMHSSKWDILTDLMPECAIRISLFPLKK